MEGALTFEQLDSSSRLEAVSKGCHVGAQRKQHVAAIFATDRHSGRLRQESTTALRRNARTSCETVAKIHSTAAHPAAALYGLWEHRKLRRDASRAECAEWLHQSCARGLSAINVHLSTTGALPSHGLIVSNHLSYLDILVMSSAVPCVFVSKAEVEQWPIFRPLCPLGGKRVRAPPRPCRCRARERQCRRESCKAEFQLCFFPRAPRPTDKAFCAFTPPCCSRRSMQLRR